MLEINTLSLTFGDEIILCLLASDNGEIKIEHNFKKEYELYLKLRN